MGPVPAGRPSIHLLVGVVIVARRLWSRLIERQQHGKRRGRYRCYHGHCGDDERSGYDGCRRNDRHGGDWCGRYCGSGRGHWWWRRCHRPRRHGYQRGGGGTGGSGALAGSAGASGSGGSSGTPGSCPASGWKPGDQLKLALTFGGVARTYDVHIPASYTGATAVPLVMTIHGAHNTSALARSWSKMNAVSDQNGFIVVYPQGVECWNSGFTISGCAQAPDDVGFLKAVVADVESHACIDPKQVYATGISN